MRLVSKSFQKFKLFKVLSKVLKLIKFFEIKFIISIQPEIELDEEENAKLEERISKDRKQLEEDKKALEAEKSQFATSREETSDKSTEMKGLRIKLADLKRNIE